MNCLQITGQYREEWISLTHPVTADSFSSHGAEVVDGNGRRLENVLLAQFRNRLAREPLSAHQSDLAHAIEEAFLGERPADHVEHVVEIKDVVIPRQEALEDVVKHREKVRRPAHGDAVRILARQQEVVTIEVY
jgi:hypothetical protein